VRTHNFKIILSVTSTHVRFKYQEPPPFLCRLTTHLKMNILISLDHFYFLSSFSHFEEGLKTLGGHSQTFQIFPSLDFYEGIAWKRSNQYPCIDTSDQELSTASNTTVLPNPGDGRRTVEDNEPETDYMPPQLSTAMNDPASPNSKLPSG
jgi:hypothetical protein